MRGGTGSAPRGGVMRAVWKGLALVFIVSAVSCGGKRSDVVNPTPPNPPIPPAASNVVSVIVDGGPAAAPGTVNTLFTTVTICVPGSTTQCQTIDHVQVDTGSYGFRVLASVLSLALPAATNSAGNALVECTQFVDGFSWGPVSSADIQVSGEKASAVPIQVIGGSSFPVPAACSGTGTEEDTVATFGANGILGIGVFEQDCGAGCANGSTSGFYYACTPTACLPTIVPLNSQVLNPVPLFATDNNGTLIELPAVAAAGAATVTGALIFGIDTQSNNASGNQTVLTVDPNVGEFTTMFNGQSLDGSFIDSGSNGVYFNDSSIPACTDPNFSGFYCPATTQNLTAVLQGATTSISATVNFSVGNTETVSTANPTFAALPTIAGPIAVTPSDPEPFDWGLPFFYGRTVINAIEQHSTKVGTGPYVAF